MAKKKEPRPELTSTSFEESLAELERIVGELESGKLGLSSALARYEQGINHLKFCQELLEKAERRIEVLSGVDANGNPISQAFDDRDTDSLEEKAALRGQRRTSVAKSASVSSAARDDDMDEAGRLF